MGENICGNVDICETWVENLPAGLPFCYLCYNYCISDT